VWIEIYSCNQPRFFLPVTTLRWCGLKWCQALQYRLFPGSPPCGGVDWNTDYKTKLLDVPVTTLRWCGLKFSDIKRYVDVRASPPCGGVDWNQSSIIAFCCHWCHHLAVVWIEIASVSNRCSEAPSHHLAVVWIEISTFHLIDSYWAVTILRWCELKFYKSPPLLYNRVITSK